MINIKRVLFIACLALAITCLSEIKTLGQQAESYPAFTLRGQVTDYDNGGNSFPAYAETRYCSSTGDWRYVAEYPGGNIIETIYRHGQGVYISDNKNKQMLKISEAGSETLKLTTAEMLRADPKFVRVERVLDLLAYVHRRQIDKSIEETYFAPELGRTPFKRITTFANGYKRVEEPVSLVMEEPMPSELLEADSLRIDKIPVFSDKIGERLQVKPAPIYPPEALTRGISGTVTVVVVIDELGKVISARVSSIPLPFLDESAMNAAYQAQFAALESGAKQGKMRGLIKYEFAPPKSLSSNKQSGQTPQQP